MKKLIILLTLSISSTFGQYDFKTFTGSLDSSAAKYFPEWIQFLLDSRNFKNYDYPYLQVGNHIESILKIETSVLMKYRVDMKNQDPEQKMVDTGIYIPFKIDWNNSRYRICLGDPIIAYGNMLNFTQSYSSIKSLTIRDLENYIYNPEEKKQRQSWFYSNQDIFADRRYYREMARLSMEYMSNIVEKVDSEAEYFEIFFRNSLNEFKPEDQNW